ncbi:hypothetical protein VI06_21150 [Aquitalea magnusonii]|nr:hypothetical protein VI06_21150 [Aquitalea magnusonii]
MAYQCDDVAGRRSNDRGGQQQCDRVMGHHKGICHIDDRGNSHDIMAQVMKKIYLWINFSRAE